MRILDRYLVRSFVGPLVFCLLLFLTMFIIIDCLNQLDDYLAYHTPLETIALYYLNMIPMVLGHILPAAMMIAALYALSAMNRSNEIIAIKANGVSGYQILLPLFFIGLLISIGLLAMNETVTPRSALVSSSIKQGLIKTSKDGPGRRSIQNVAALSGKHRMIYMRELAINTRSMYDVIVLEHRADLSISTKTTAQRGVYQDGAWTFYDVLEYELDASGNMVGRPVSFEKKRTEITDSPEAFLKQHSEPELMSFRQLRQYITNTRRTGFRASKHLELELHQKLSTPFICFILLWVVSPMALRMQRGGAMLSLGLGLAVLVSFYSVAAFVSALGKGGLIPAPFAAWAPHAAFMIIGAGMVKRNM